MVKLGLDAAKAQHPIDVGRLVNRRELVARGLSATRAQRKARADETLGKPLHALPGLGMVSSWVVETGTCAQKDAQHVAMPNSMTFNCGSRYAFRPKNATKLRLRSGIMRTRLATPADGAAIRAVYAPYVENSTYTFEFEVPTIEEVCDRMTRHPRHLWLVMEESAEILGYAYAWPFEDREGYRFTVETSVFVRQDRIGGGVGRALYADLLAALKLKGFTTAVARIALPNLASERLHEKLGFKKVAHFERIGHKFDRWVDVGYWQCSL